jgi:hypothetical protein
MIHQKPGVPEAAARVLFERDFGHPPSGLFPHLNVPAGTLSTDWSYPHVQAG